MRLSWTSSTSTSKSLRQSLSFPNFCLHFSVFSCVLHVPLLLPLEQGLAVWRVIPLWAQKPKTLKRVETFNATHKAFLMLFFPTKHTSYTTPLCPLNPSCLAISVTCHTSSHSFYAPLPPHPTLHHVFISSPSTHHLCFTMPDLCNFFTAFLCVFKIRSGFYKFGCPSIYMKKRSCATHGGAVRERGSLKT